MIKYFSLISVIVILLFVNCNNTQKVHITEQILPIENFIDTFIHNNPNYALNDITIENTNKLFTKTILDSLKRTNLLNGIPMRLEDIHQKGNHTMVHFTTWIEPYNWQYKGIISEINVDIISSINDSLITILENDKYYKIYGKYIKRLNLSTAQTLFGERIRVYTTNISIEKEFNSTNINLGTLHFKIDSIAPFNGREKQYIKL